jgi:hypothetical protein
MEGNARKVKHRSPPWEGGAGAGAESRSQEVKNSGGKCGRTEAEVGYPAPLRKACLNLSTGTVLRVVNWQAPQACSTVTVPPSCATGR